MKTLYYCGHKRRFRISMHPDAVWHRGRRKPWMVLDPTGTPLNGRALTKTKAKARAKKLNTQRRKVCSRR